MKTYTIYQLTLSDDPCGIYIGITSIRPTERKATHKDDAKKNKPNKRSQWIRAGLLRGAELILTVLEKDLSPDYGYAREQELIQQARNNPDLVCYNTDDGGAPNWSQAHTPENREKARLAIQESNSQHWLVTSPLGVTFTVKNMKQFCRDNQLDPGTMSQVARGNQDNHKGWKCLRLGKSLPEQVTPAAA